ncbi:MAG: HesA/MoeB/ThiF family protein [Methanomicrobiales archaeon]|nr:HesA/MoeB/ThiF family protein [Methanomicrobiales archaeon]
MAWERGTTAQKAGRERRAVLSPDEVRRYRRQMDLIGKDGQERLKGARVTIAGSGGLGCPVATYLALAGVGWLRIIDQDVVDISNLNRQFLHRDMDLGRPKAESAGEKLREMNPHITIEAVQATIEEGSVSGLIGDTDLIIDAVDSYAARYLLNREAVRRGIPFIHGAIRGFDGQAMTVLPGKTACLRCVIPRAPPPETPPVVGATAGVIALVQATEALKFLLGTGNLLGNRLLLWEGLEARMTEVAVERNPRCPDCGGVILP